MSSDHITSYLWCARDCSSQQGGRSKPKVSSSDTRRGRLAAGWCRVMRAKLAGTCLARHQLTSRVCHPPFVEHAADLS